MTLDRDAGSTDALLTDLYLDALLAGAVLEAAATGSPDGPAARIDPAARQAADRLRRDLVRVHPSFRFEERLATRLAEAAVGLRLPLAAGGDERVVPLRGRPTTEPDPSVGPLDGDTPRPFDAGGPGVAADGRRGDAAEPTIGPDRRVAARPFLIGGALTSAALSIAGAAIVAWRLGRPGRSNSPMVRAARAVRESRLAAVGDVNSRRHD